MRVPTLLLVALLLASLPATAENVLGPADYLAILAASKIHYKLINAPSQKPVKVLDCPRRDVNLRLVTEGNARTLVPWLLKPEAQKLVDEGDALFSAKNLAEAGEKFKAATAADPDAAVAFFWYGDTLLFGAHDAAAALDQYRKGTALDPTLPIGYFFASTALVRLGRADEAREEIIKALTRHPAYEAVWKAVLAQPQRFNMKPVIRYRFDPPEGYLGGDRKSGVDIFGGPQFEFGGYAICKAVWANEARFSRQHATGTGWSTEEEHACVLNQIIAGYNSTQTKLEEQQKKNGVAKPGIRDDEIVAALPPLERHLWDVSRAHLLDGYILFEIIGQHCPVAMSMMDDSAREQVRSYIAKYVIVPSE
jgi:tetratricopeptide (TPR) repeat protein